MLTLVREGGYPMLLILGFGFTALLKAAGFAVRPVRRKLPLIHWLMAATLFAVLAGFAADLGAVFHFIPSRFSTSPEALRALPALAAERSNWPFVLITGLGESMAPGILGFTLLSLVSLVRAVGEHRLARVES
jgi:hypothetical protein